MSLQGASRRERLSWPMIACLLLLGFTGGLIAVRHWPGSSVPSDPPVAMVPAAPKQVGVKPVGPTFDIVRVGPQGRAVIAGRAASGAEVTIHDGERTVGKAVADAQGQFVIIPDAALAPGGRELTLSARNADGQEVAGGDSVFLAIPAAPTPAEVAPSDAAAAGAVAVLLPHGAGAPRTLQGAGRKLALGTVDYDEHGEIRFAGSAKPNVSVRVYVDNQAVGDTSSGAGGEWALTPGNTVAPGVHKLRVDQLEAAGGVSSRIELPFQRAAAAPGADGRAIVQPGQNLWRIARQSYGQGTRYTVIFLANRDQIRDPKLIYPGQIFTVPPHS